jgi:hypothetical protein
MPHPRDTVVVPAGERAGRSWTETRDGIEVETRWGLPDDPFDPIAQIRTESVETRVRAPGRPEEVHRTKVRMREWTATEMEAVIRLSGAFEIAERHGRFERDAPFDDAPGSWRMILVLRKL